MPVARIYIRFSHEDSSKAKGGVSAEVQERDAREFFRWTLAPRGFTLDPVLYIDEAVSAFHNDFCDRKSGKAILAASQPRDCIITRLDRAFRNTEDALRTKRRLKDYMLVAMYFVDLPIATDNAAGVLSYTMSSAVAQHESARKSERTLDAIKLRRELGLPTNKPPRGFQKDWVTYDLQARARMQEVVRLRDKEGYSVRDICRWLKSKGAACSRHCAQSDYWMEKAIQRLEATGQKFTGHDALYLRWRLEARNTTRKAKTGKWRFFERPPPSVLVADIIAEMPPFEVQLIADRTLGS